MEKGHSWLSEKFKQPFLGGVMQGMGKMSRWSAPQDKSRFAVGAKARK